MFRKLHGSVRYSTCGSLYTAVSRFQILTRKKGKSADYLLAPFAIHFLDYFDIAIIHLRAPAGGTIYTPHPRTFFCKLR
jgi:hypothetical protein